MTLRDASDTFIRWAGSCTREDQLSLLNEAIDSLIIARYRADPSLTHEVSRIMIAIQEQAKIVQKEPFPVLNLN